MILSMSCATALPQQNRPSPSSSRRRRAEPFSLVLATLAASLSLTDATPNIGEPLSARDTQRETLQSKSSRLAEKSLPWEVLPKPLPPKQQVIMSSVDLLRGHLESEAEYQLQDEERAFLSHGQCVVRRVVPAPAHLCAQSPSSHALSSVTSRRELEAGDPPSPPPRPPTV